MEPQPPSSNEPVRHRETGRGAGEKRTIPSEEILRGDREVWIRHADAIYRLCVTRNGKLILQK